ncbi:AbiH family protein [Sphingobacterium bovisgrunnientis]|uniref:AbiH family protein n=1 Tax=Sphingobacterium bovisgrunnientis TaxID=1874697 RepID=UPI001357CACF
MNRLIIIGNGFDLAHGLPTSYSHFIKYIWSNIFKYSKDNDYKYSHLITTS